jgi:hypothetical protein
VSSEKWGVYQKKKEMNKFTKGRMKRGIREKLVAQEEAERMIMRKEV